MDRLPKRRTGPRPPAVRSRADTLVRLRPRPRSVATSQIEEPRSVEVLVHVRLAPTTAPAMFAAYLHSEPTVLHAWRTAGDIDFEVHLRCQALGDLHALLTRARCLGGARETTTHLILNSAG